MILKRLRQETLQHHDQLERQSPLRSPQLTLAGYHQLLLRFYGYYKPLEERLTKSVRREAAFFDQNGRRKSQFLEQDLAALNQGATDGLKLVPRCEILPLLENIPQLLGCLYVLEGATLDGQVITAHLQTHLGLTPQSGTAFFHGYGPETMRQWQIFGAGLEVEAQKADADDDIVDNANRTFETMTRWLYPKPEAAG